MTLHGILGLPFESLAEVMLTMFIGVLTTLRRAATFAAFVCLAACDTVPLQASGTLPSLPDPVPVTISATVAVSYYRMKAYDVTIRMDGDKVMTGDRLSAEITGTFRGHNVRSKCSDKATSLAWIGYDVVCKVYVNSDLIGIVTAAPEPID